MDGKYSKYIENFMSNFTIKGEEVHIHTSQNEKGETLTYPVSREIVTRCNQKLDQEYLQLDKNKKEIKQDTAKKTRKIIYGIGGSILGIGIVLGIISILTTVPAVISFIVKILPAAGILEMLCGEVGLAIHQTNFDKEMKMVSYYRNNKKSIESLMQQDENITKNLSKETMQLIETKENLKSEGYSEEVLDMDFIDKLLESKPQGKKDLSTLLRMYKSVLIMASDPIYHSPNKTSKAPSKKKKPGKK